MDRYLLQYFDVAGGKLWERGILMEDVRKKTEVGQPAGGPEQAAGLKKPDNENCAQESQESRKSPVSETWAQETIEDLDDFIESQGVYIRQ